MGRLRRQGLYFLICLILLSCISTGYAVDLVSDMLEEGESRTYTINNEDFLVNVLIITDNLGIVKFKVNDTVSNELTAGSNQTIGNLVIKVLRIILNEAEEVTGGDLVEFEVSVWAKNSPVECGIITK